MYGFLIQIQIQKSESELKSYTLIKPIEWI